MGGAEIGGIYDDSKMDPETVDLLKKTRDILPGSLDHVIFASEVPQPTAEQVEEVQNAS
jgi:hypothetical protein